MSYLVLARKFRPTKFSEVTGQEQVTRTLANSIARNKIAHAMLFAGPRGVGKTSIARILARALNCQHPQNNEPCGECRACREITAGTSLAVREIDGASHNSVDNVRDLIESFRALPPPEYRSKVYIIDEVHMLSTSAFNALLKSLEEPPPNTVFILATTEIHKIPETVISRCQRHDFKAMTPEQIESRLKTICEREGFEIEPEALRMIGRLSDGSMRDSQSLLDRVHAFCDGAITADAVTAALGMVGRAALFELAGAIIARTSDMALVAFEGVIAAGADPGIFAREFATVWREIMISRCCGAGALEAIGLRGDEAQRVAGIAAKLSAEDAQDLAALARDGADKAIRSTFPVFALEAVVVRMACREPVAAIRDIIEKLRTTSGVAQRGNGGGGSGGGGIERPVTRSTPVAKASAAAVRVESPALITQNASTRESPKVVAVASGTFTWDSFVAFVDQGGRKVLAEQLRRVVPESFISGSLKVKGGAFALNYLRDNGGLLKDALVEFSKVADWVVILANQDGSGVPQGSIVDREARRMAAEKVEAEQRIANHPSLKALQKAFPGSTIEDISPSEES